MTHTATPWSDDCLACLCHLPHTMQAHLHTVERARAELAEQLLLLRYDHPSAWREDEDTDDVDDSLS